MNFRYLAITLSAVTALIAGWPGAAAGQSFPQPPHRPMAMSECDAYAARWADLLNSLRAQHDSCLNGSKNCKSLPGLEGPTCSCSNCQSLHEQRDAVSSARGPAVSECRETVRAYEREMKRREEEAKRKREEEERRRREEEQRRQEEERKRQQEEERQRREDEARRQQEDRERETQADEDRRQRDADDRQRRLQDERDRADRDRRDREERARQEAEAEKRAERIRNQVERDMKARETAADMSRIQQEFLERRNQQREQHIQQIEQERWAKQEAMRREQERTGTTAANAFDKLKDAVKDAVRPAGSTRSADDLLGGFAMDDATSTSDRTARTIDDLLDRAKSGNPLSRIPLEMLRQPLQSVASMPDRIFDAIGDVENANVAALDAIPGQFQQELLSPSRFASVLIKEGVTEFRERYKGAITKHAAEETLPIAANIQQRASQAYYNRDVGALVRSNAQNRVQWLTEGAARSGLYETAANGVAVLYDENGNPFRFDPKTKMAGYSAKDIPTLIEKFGLRLQPLRMDPFIERTVLFTPMPEKSADALATQLLNDWMAGKLVGAAFKPLEGR